MAMKPADRHHLDTSILSAQMPITMIALQNGTQGYFWIVGNELTAHDELHI